MHNVQPAIAPTAPADRAHHADRADRADRVCPTAGIATAIGNTPALYLRLEHDGRPVEILAKMEMFNLSASIKDRMAINIMRHAYRTGALQAGQCIVEATSGNAGIAFAALGAALGHPVIIFMPDWMSVERRQLIESYGAQVRPVSRAEGGFLGAIDRAEEMAAATGAFLPRQFCNEDNCSAHLGTTLPELTAQAAHICTTLTGFVAGVGTGGTIMGAARYFAQHQHAVPVHPVEPASSPTLSTGHKVGQHRMQGISDEFIPSIVKLDELSGIIAVDDGDAILMAQRFLRELGIGVGISAGGNIVAAIRAARDQYNQHPDRVPVIGTVLCDNHTKYLSTDLMRTEPVRPQYITPDVSFTGSKIVAPIPGIAAV